MDEFTRFNKLAGLGCTIRLLSAPKTFKMPLKRYLKNHIFEYSKI